MSFLYVTFSAFVSALQTACSFVFMNWACARDCFTGSQNCHQVVEFGNTITSEEAVFVLAMA